MAGASGSSDEGSGHEQGRGWKRLRARLCRLGKTRARLMENQGSARRGRR